MIIKTLIAAHIAGFINAARGSGLSKEGGISAIFSKLAAVAALAGLMYIVTQDIGATVAYAVNFYFVLLMGTGFLMIAFKEKGGANLINSKDEFKPIDMLVDMIVGDVVTEADARRYAVWLGTLFGLVGYMQFIAVSSAYGGSLWPLIIGLPVLSYGLIAGAMRYIAGTNVWRIVEYLWAALYIACSIFSHYSVT